MKRELIVVTTPAAGLDAPPSTMQAVAAPAERLSDFVAGRGYALEPVFPHTASEGPPSADDDELTAELARYHAVSAPDEELDRIAEELRERPDVSRAYIKPAGEPPYRRREPRNGEPAAPRAAVQSFTQEYLDAGPRGVGARHAWAIAGGDGAGVNIIDLEWAWQWTHEDLQMNKRGCRAGVQSGETNHGTAVLGVMAGDHNNIGVTGICPQATVGAVAFSMATARAIKLAADLLAPGDILLLEIHRPGPASGPGRPSQWGYIAIEWWRDDFLAIRYAIERRGVIVVEAAGNGSQDLDAALYDTPDPSFASEWRNPFRPGNPQSGAILVGAGAPPSGNYGPDRSRLDFSNHGARVDCQGWGEEVTTCGYGDLQGGADPDRWYTHTFNGTSSASPMIAGVLGCLQGIRRAAGKAPLTPAQARNLLLDPSLGSPQQAGQHPVSERIGARPDLAQLVQIVQRMP